jgi:hypothetical protein
VAISAAGALSPLSGADAIGAMMSPQSAKVWAHNLLSIAQVLIVNVENAELFVFMSIENGHSATWYDDSYQVAE